MSYCNPKSCKGILYDLQGHLLLRRVVGASCPSNGGGLGGRGQITAFSPRAGARMRRYLRTCAAEYRVFITLTYPREWPTDGSAVKRNLRAFLARYRRASGNDAWSAFWFLEFQERGAPHFHIFGTDRIDHAELARWWYEIVGSGESDHLKAGTSIEALKSGRHGTCAYASKYAAKAEQKVIPPNYFNSGRFWGIEGLRTCMSATIFVHEDMINSPVYVTFRAELKELLAKHKAEARALSLRGVSSGLYIKTQVLQAEIRLLFARYGTLFTISATGAYETPAFGAEQMLLPERAL